jgi:3-oxoacyl-[acyl-carrier protein] reductase
MELKGKVAIVTGGSKGIGRAIALALAREGCSLAICARGKESLEKTKTEIEQTGARVLAMRGDLREESFIPMFVQQTVTKFGRLDILVNNAGVGYFHPVAEFPTEIWDAMFDLNVRSVFLMTRECLPHLRKTGDSVIVNVVSLAGKNFFAGGSGYVATKHAVLGFSRCLMLEERNNGVRVLAICPGSVDTDFHAGEKSVAATRRERMLQPEDVAESILHMIKLPQRAMVSEIDIRPTFPK